MKKLSALLMVLTILATPVLAKGGNSSVAEAVAEVVPNQDIENVKAYTGINYNRQDSEKVGMQKIVNDHSWFNININIIKKGALFKGKNVVVETEEETEE